MSSPTNIEDLHGCPHQTDIKSFNVFLHLTPISIASIHKDQYQTLWSWYTCTESAIRLASFIISVQLGSGYLCAIRVLLFMVMVMAMATVVGVVFVFPTPSVQQQTIPHCQKDKGHSSGYIYATRFAKASNSKADWQQSQQKDENVDIALPFAFPSYSCEVLVNCHPLDRDSVPGYSSRKALADDQELQVQRNYIYCKLFLYCVGVQWGCLIILT